MTLIFATQSVNKLQEAERILNTSIQRFDIDLPEIQSVDVEEVVTYKARYAYAAVQKAVMIEDTGLYIQAFNGLPGALVKWFVLRVGVDGLCAMLRPYADRTAWAKTIIGTYNGVGEPLVFSGEIRGTIAPEPRGSAGFGWDAIFIPAGAAKTFAEMLPEEKDAFSMRRLALEKMRDAHTF